MRRQLGREYARIVRSRNRGVDIPKDDLRLVSPILHGKNESGGPACSHDCAFYLPTDEDCDGRIDHITVFASGKFSRDDVSALDKLRTLSFGKDGEPDEESESNKRRVTHRLLLTGLDSAKPAHVGQFQAARVWESATPYIAFRHLKERGAKRDRREFTLPDAMPEFMEHVLGEDFAQRADLPKPETITFVPDPLAALGWRYRSLQFKRGRNRRGDDGYSRPFGAFRITFAVPISGPLSLGYALHFGMGAFRPFVEKRGT